jgi:hypothetical protein
MVLVGDGAAPLAPESEPDPDVEPDPLLVPPLCGSGELVCPGEPGPEAVIVHESTVGSHWVPPPLLANAACAQPAMSVITMAAMRA